MKNKYKNIFLRISGIQATLIMIFALIMGNLAFIPRIFAQTYLTKSTVMLYNMDASGNSEVAFAFTTATAGATSVTLDFNGWTGSTAGIVNTTQTISTTGCTAITGASTALPGSITAAGSSSTVTVSSVTALSASTSYCAILTSASAVTNPSATGDYTVTITAGSDTSTVAVDVISNDQVIISAVVPPTFSLALSSNTDSFTSNLSPSSIVGTTGITATVNTNAKNGWFLWGVDSNAGLRSATQSYTIASTTPGTNATLTAGTEGYLTGLPSTGITQGSGSGTTSATTAYASSGSGNGSGLNSTEHLLASSTGTANGAVVTIKEYAAISSVTPAASDYSDTITLVGAGSF